MIGVNGVGKTTTIGKLAHQLQQQGKKVLLCAGRYLPRRRRRAAGDLGQARPGADHRPARTRALTPPPWCSTPSARPRPVSADVHYLRYRRAACTTRQNLMDELAEDRRVIGRELPGAPAARRCWSLDATTGQNGLHPGQAYSRRRPSSTGIVLTKLDGTAKGGVVIAVSETRCNFPSSSSASASRSTTCMPVPARRLCRGAAVEAREGEKQV